MPANILGKELIGKIIDTWGISAQLDMLMEEMSELMYEIARVRNLSNVQSTSLVIKAFLKDIRKSHQNRMVNVNATEEDLKLMSDELADVHIMIEQVMGMFDLESKFEKYRMFKRDRIIERLKKHG